MKFSLDLTYHRTTSILVSITLLIALSITNSQAFSTSNNLSKPEMPVPLIEKGHPVDWWFVFKFNSKAFPGCGKSSNDKPTCLFGGDVQNYVSSQQFVYASSEDDRLKQGGGCIGDTLTDPVGATFNEAYSGQYHYVIWNDQFYEAPHIKGCSKSCSAPWGHSKGMLVWNEAGNGFVMQVTTPSWPASGSVNHPRQGDGNTLGCVLDDDVKVSQDFFALKLTKNDVIDVLKALANASVVTDVSNPQLVQNGGPTEIQKLVSRLGNKSHATEVLKFTLSSGIALLSKPSALHVPPWQMVSAELGGISLRTATWWTSPKIDSTTTSTPIKCWDKQLGKPGGVEISTAGHWGDQSFSLKGGPGKDSNHAKIGVSTNKKLALAIFGDMNQQGAISGTEKNCGRSQNGRGGLFYVLKDKQLARDINTLISDQ